MPIPIRPADPGDPYTFQMAFDAREDLASATASLLQTNGGLQLGALAVDVEAEVVSASVNGETISVPGWRRSHTLTPYPANYVADRVLDFFGLPATP